MDKHTEADEHMQHGMIDNYDQGILNNDEILGDSSGVIPGGNLHH